MPLLPKIFVSGILYNAPIAFAKNPPSVNIIALITKVCFLILFHLNTQKF